MRWSSVLLPFTLLAAGALADDPSQRFLDLHKKALASAPIKLDDASYKKATSLPRDYSVAVLLTATDPRFGCQMCREFGPDWNLLASQWTKGDKPGDSKVIFSVLDFNDGRDTFMSVSIWSIGFPLCDVRLKCFAHQLFSYSSASRLPLSFCSSNPLTVNSRSQALSRSGLTLILGT